MYKKHYTLFVAITLALSFNSDSAFGENVESKSIFLECNVSTTVTKPNEFTERQSLHYLIDENTGYISRYNEITNVYDPICVSNKSIICSISKDTISLVQSLNETQSTMSNNIVINRWSGSYIGISRLSLKKSDYVFEVLSKGVCEAGSDRRIPNKKF